MATTPERDAKLSQWLRAVRDLPLDSHSKRYVQLDGGITGPVGLRGERIDRKHNLFDVIYLADDADVDWQPTCQLFSGFRGTGKSTELLRLKRLLEDHGYVVLLADARLYHSLARDLSVEELMFIIAGALGEAASEELGQNLALPSGWKYLAEWLKGVPNLAPAITLGPLELKGALKNEDAYLADLRASMKGRLEALVTKAHGYTADLVARIKKARRDARGVVFILDNLERMSAPDHQFVARMESMVEVFARHANALRLPACHTIYSVPLYLERIQSDLDRDYNGTLQVLPTVKVHVSRDPERPPFAPGVAALREVLDRRLPLGEIFTSEAHIERVVLASGGHLRALLKMVETILRLARRSTLPVPELVVDMAIAQYAEKLRDAVRLDGLAVLDGIRRTFALDHVTSQDLPRLAHYLDSNLVHCYRNGDGWYDVHPLLLDHLAELAATYPASAAPAVSPLGAPPDTDV